MPRDGLLTACLAASRSRPSGPRPPLPFFSGADPPAGTFYLRRTKEAMIYFPERRADGTGRPSRLLTKRLSHTVDVQIDRRSSPTARFAEIGSEN